MAERSQTKPRSTRKARKKALGEAQSNGTASPIGDNSRSFGVDVPDEVYTRNMAAIALKRIAMDKANEVYKKRKGEYGSACKLAEDEGVNVDAVHLARKLDKQDRIEVARLYKDTGRVLALSESPLATQLNMFADVDLPPPENPVIAGELAGKRGDDRTANPHKPGSEAFTLYDAAWMRGQSAIAEALGRGRA